MEKSLFFSILCVGFILLDAVNSFPIDISSVSEGVSNPVWLTNYFFSGFGFFLIIVSIIFGCVCCRNGKGFKQFRNSSGNLTVSPPDGFVNPTLNSELTIFPPLGASANEIHRFEPLPDIKSQVPNLRPAAFSYVEQEISSQDWFVDPYSNFPRNQLKYLQEYGKGWFGRVVEGEAQNITPEEKVTKVMVKILHEDATPTDHMYFLHEVKFYRDLKHPNILHLLGRCLETEPFLIILECYSNGDLKTFLSQNLASAQALVEQGVTLQMCSNITSGLQFMHDNKFIHTDLAARNCLVGPDLSIKIGDYGNSIEVFKSDYYCAGSVALPIRWCAPETLKCTDITIETREVTPPANIWSLGVLFWEICEFCKLPYAELNDDEVIVRVLGEKNYFLEKPNMMCLHKDELYHLMKLCWKPPVQRPTALQIYIVLNNLISSSNLTQKVHTDSKRIYQDFEQRWHNSKPNSIPKTDNAIDNDHSIPVDCNIMPLKLKNAKVVDSSYVDSPLGKFLSNKNADQKSPRFSLKFDKKSVHNIEKNRTLETSGFDNSKINLEGKDNVGNNDFTESVSKVEFDITAEPKNSDAVEGISEIEPGMDSWLKGVEINNEEDESFVRKISAAIRDLDETLALEKTSSSEENSEKSSRQNSPGKDVHNANNPIVDFKLGDDTSSFINFTQKTFELTSLQNSAQPQSLNFTDPLNDKKSEGNENYEPGSLIVPFIKDSVNKCRGDVLYESFKENDSYLCGQSRNSSDTDDEVWRRRIEKGEISEKVKEKSKSIANLMILTHIDSDDSDIDFEKPFEKGLNRNSFIRRSGSFAKSLSSNNCGSESDLTFAVLEDDFKESLRKLTSDHKEHGHFDSLGVILPSSANRENVWENLFKTTNPFIEPTSETSVSSSNVNKFIEDSKLGIEQLSEKNIPTKNTQNGNNFLGKVASENSEKFIKKEKDQINNYSIEHCIEKKTINLDKEILAKEHLNCNDSLFMSAPKISGHLKKGVPSSKMNTEINSPFDSEILLLKKDHNTVERPCKETESTFLDENINKENCDQNTKDFSLKTSPIPLKFRDLNSTDEKNYSDLSAGIVLVESANKDVIEAENFWESDNTDREVSKSILKDDVSLPEIIISEEPTKSVSEDEQEEFKMEKKKPRTLKFVLKDDDFEESHKDTLKSSTDLGNLFVTENFRNSFDKDELREKSTVIVGACEDFTMDYFKGLKTTSGAVQNECIEDFENYQNDEDLDVWDKHLEKAFTQQLSNVNFDEINFRSFGSDCFDNQETKQISTFSQFINSSTFSCPIESIEEFIKNEKNHTEKVEEPIHLNNLTGLTVIANEEEYEHFKLRTPDDERSSDSGFRDKGSLSESVEDGCDGKYNLEDIEAELEEAFVKGVFGNSGADKEKDFSGDSKNFNNFDYEESKFYEDGNKNEDLSDLDGEIEFWNTKDNPDYYPEISEFHPSCSQGWYLHPPDENMFSFQRNISEDIVNAFRNELRESLPVQRRSFEEFDDFYETDIEDGKRNLNIHYGSEFGLPLSPILEEQNSLNFITQKNIKNSLLEGGKARNKIVKLMESVKAVDTNTFMQYLDYMIENEGRDLSELEEKEESTNENIENRSSLMLILKDANSEDVGDNSEEFSKMAVENARAILKTDILGKNDVTLLENTELDFLTSFNNTQEQKDDCLEIWTDSSENDGLVYTSEILSPDREKSLSELSRSSNGTRTGDALSEVTLSSPDLVPDCFSSSVLEVVSHEEGSKANKEFDDLECKNKYLHFDKAIISHDSVNEKSDLSNTPLDLQRTDDSSVVKSKNNVVTNPNKTLNIELNKNELLKSNHASSNLENMAEANDLYEMSTSFMGTEDEEENITLDLGKFEKTEELEEPKGEQKSLQDSVAEDSYTGDWQSESSEGEEMFSSSSSEEFIWKDGNKEAKIKAACASDFVPEHSLFDKFQNEPNTTLKPAAPKSESLSKDDSIEKSDGDDDDDDDDDDDGNESSSGSSASITDFVPSAWNSQATPRRPVLRSPDKKVEKQKKNVWFKKQKYHCVYEYPREPSDNEDADGSSYTQTSFDKGFLETPMKHFNFGVNTVELPNHNFPYGISKVIDYSSYTDWDVVEAEDPDLSLTDTDSENGLGKIDLGVPKKTDVNFYNLSPFDYDFNTTDMPEGKSEFVVSSSSRPFQKSSTITFSPEPNHSEVNNTDYEKLVSKDFITPDSGIEDSSSVTPSEKVDFRNENVLTKVTNLSYPETDLIDILDNLKFDFTSEAKEDDRKEADFVAFAEKAKFRNAFPVTENSSISLSNNGLGELRHTRGKLKLDLPSNHNSDLGAIINKKNH